MAEFWVHPRAASAQWVPTGLGVHVLGWDGIFPSLWPSFPHDPLLQ